MKNKEIEKTKYRTYLHRYYPKHLQHHPDFQRTHHHIFLRYVKEKIVKFSRYFTLKSFRNLLTEITLNFRLSTYLTES